MNQKGGLLIEAMFAFLFMQIFLIFSLNILLKGLKQREEEFHLFQKSRSELRERVSSSLALPLDSHLVSPPSRKQ
jgi:hypothetical protein